MMGNYHVRFGGRERDVLARGITLPTQCRTFSRLPLCKPESQTQSSGTKSRTYPAG
jgi:hypothetical protein